MLLLNFGWLCLTLLISFLFVCKSQYKHFPNFENCYVVNDATKQIWQLVKNQTFQDIFNSSLCSEFISCNQNVNLFDNLLILSASHIPNTNVNISNNFLLTEKHRFELRFASSMDENVKICLTAFESYLNLSFMSCYMKNFNGFNNNLSLYVEKRLIFFNNSYIKDTTHKENTFHLWGFEFQDNEIKFFFDDNYSEAWNVKYSNLTLFNNIQIQNEDVMTETKSIDQQDAKLIKQNSTCRAIFIDYIRIYKIILPKDFQKPNQFLLKCPDNRFSNPLEEWRIKNVCKNFIKFNKNNLTTNEESGPNSIGCLEVDSKSNLIWKLIWQDSFANENSLSNWDVRSATLKCTEPEEDEFARQFCALPDNVELNKGYLQLNTRKEQFGSFIYTGALITSKKYFSEGRFEIRALYPTKDEIEYACIRTVDQREIKAGEIAIACYSAAGTFHRGIYNKQERLENQIQNDDSEIRFHLVGIEWNNQNLRFFFDHKYSEWFNVSAKQNLHQIQMEIGIDDRGKFIDHYYLSHKLRNCPILLVDYVRVYEKVNFDYLKKNSKNRLCEKPKSSNRENQIIQNACQMAMLPRNISYSDKIEIEKTFWSNHWNYILIIFLFVLSITIVYIVLKIRKIVKNKMKMNLNNTNVTNIDQNNIYEDIIYEEIDAEDQEKENYLELSDKYPEYVPIARNVLKAEF